MVQPYFQGGKAGGVPRNQTVLGQAPDKTRITGDPYWTAKDYKDFDIVLFVHGYGETRPRTCWTVKNIRVGTGNPEWGALPGVVYFIIELGAEVTPPKNQKPT